MALGKMAYASWPEVIINMHRITLFCEQNRHAGAIHRKVGIFRATSLGA